MNGNRIAASTTAARTREEDLHVLRSPTVGIFHESRVPGGQPFVEAGNMVEAGQITGLIEILRLMSEIASDVAGEIVEKMVSDGEPVEYGQALFAIRPCKNNLSRASGI
jgi:acetyl-CoA carboxylase biotin carboxyl carrier protein